MPELLVELKAYTANRFGLATAISVCMLDCRFGWRGWERRQPGYGEEEFVRGIEEVQVGVDGTVCGGEEDGGAARLIDGDIGFEAGAPTRLFDDVRRRVNWQDVNPSETDSGRFASVVESLLADETSRKDVDGLRGRVVWGNARATGPDEVLEPDRHIGRGGVEAGAPGGGLGGGAGSFVVRADKQTAALRCIGKERRVVHVEWVESAFSKKGRVLLVRGGL